MISRAIKDDDLVLAEKKLSLCTLKVRDSDPLQITLQVQREREIWKKCRGLLYRGRFNYCT
jgi:hypothetical protein